MRSLFCTACCLFLLTGCSTIRHELQPHRLWRLNYTDAPGRTDGGFYSVSDPLAPAERLKNSDDKPLSPGDPGR